MVARARSGCRNSFVLAAGLMLFSATLGAVVLGAALGVFGSVLDRPSRLALVVATLGAVMIGALAGPKPWQLDRETAMSWLDLQDWRTAAFNGISLGLGFTTRIGFWLYYLVIVAAVMAPSYLLAAAIVGSYGFGRVFLSLVQAGFGPTVTMRIDRGALSWLAPVTDGTLFFVSGYALVMWITHY